MALQNVLSMYQFSVKQFAEQKEKKSSDKKEIQHFEFSDQTLKVFNSATAERCHF